MPLTRSGAGVARRAHRDRRHFGRTPGDPGAAGRLAARTVGIGDGVGRDQRAGVLVDLTPAPVAQLPAVDPAARGEREPVDGQQRQLCKAAIDELPTAGDAAGIGGDHPLLGLAGDPANIAADPQIDALANPRTDLGARAEAVGGNVELIERLGDAVAARTDTGETAREFAVLEPGADFPLPQATADQPQRGIDRDIGVASEGHATFALVEQIGAIRLQLGILADRDHRTCREAALKIAGSAVDRAAVALEDRNEAVAARIAARHHREAASEIGGRGHIGVDRLAAAIGDLGIDRHRLARGDARQLDRAGERAWPEHAAAAAAGHPHKADPRRIEPRPAHPAAERIDHRYAVEQDQRARRRIAAEPAHRGALAGRMRRAGVRAAELLEAGGIAQDILHPPARRHFEPLAVDGDDVIGRVSGRSAEPLPGDDDFPGIILGRRHRRCRYHRRTSGQQR